ncbi:MAG TPA: hypothetical protein VF368_08720 [Gemmatimonadaceae bacterium]|jgi:hypothetical protein
MNHGSLKDYEVRNHILKLLSDEELASVSTAETATRLAEGDEYLDLENLDEGVKHADGLAVPIARALLRKAVLSSTWNTILAMLPPSPTLE